MASSLYVLVFFHQRFCQIAGREVSTVTSIMTGISAKTSFQLSLPFSSMPGLLRGHVFAETENIGLQLFLCFPYSHFATYA
jgi:hypothetical protein